MGDLGVFSVGLAYTVAVDNRQEKLAETTLFNRGVLPLVLQYIEKKEVGKGAAG